MLDTELKRAHETIRNAKRVLIVADERPDADSIGASSAVLNWLLQEAKNVRAFCPAPIPRTLHFLDQVHRFTNDTHTLKKPFDVILTFDAPNLELCGIQEALLHEHHLIVFDHHPTNKRYGHTNIVHEHASSTAELVHRFFEVNGIEISSAVATSLLAGVLFDTRHFSNSGTTPSSLETAGALISRGARVSEILRHTLKNKSAEILRLWGLALSRLHRHPSLGIVTTYIQLADLTHVPGGDEAMDGISNFLNAVCGGADTMLVLREVEGNKVKGSLRSITRDVSALAKLFGGGGHIRASGFTVPGRIEIKDGRPCIV